MSLILRLRRNEVIRIEHNGETLELYRAPEFDRIAFRGPMSFQINRLERVENPHDLPQQNLPQVGPRTLTVKPFDQLTDLERESFRSYFDPNGPQPTEQ